MKPSQKQNVLGAKEAKKLWLDHFIDRGIIVTAGERHHAREQSVAGLITFTMELLGVNQDRVAEAIHYETSTLQACIYKGEDIALNKSDIKRLAKLEPESSRIKHHLREDLAKERLNYRLRQYEGITHRMLPQVGLIRTRINQMVNRAETTISALGEALEMNRNNIHIRLEKGRFSAKHIDVIAEHIAECIQYPEKMASQGFAQRIGGQNSSPGTSASR